MGRSSPGALGIHENRTKMDVIIEELSSLANDRYLFFVVQGIYVSLALFAVYRDVREWWQKKHKTGRVRVSLRIKRGEKSMSMLHSAYVAIVFLIVLITLNVKVLENHRVIFVAINVGILAYLCFYNSWFRKKLLEWIAKSGSIEES